MAIRTLRSMAPLALMIAWTATLPGASRAPRSEHDLQSLPAGVSAEWWGAVQKDIARSEYHITSERGTEGSEVAYQAPNRAQNFRTRFTHDGIRVSPRGARPNETPAWQWGLELAGWGREGAPREPAPRPVMRVNGNRIEYQRGDLTEWYVNDARGLEQGFTIARRPGGDRVTRSSAEPDPLRVELNVRGGLEAVIRDDGEGVDFLAPGGARAIRFDHLVVVDARGHELPASFEPCGDPSGEERFAIVVNDQTARFPITIDPLATSPSWTAESDQSEAFFGWSVATAGDVNGDGFSDVIVGAFGFDNGQSGEGRAFVYHGSSGGLSLAANWTAESDQSSAVFGRSVATAGDVNGDGFSDVIVGAYLFDNGQSNEGRAFVYHGSSGGLSLGPAWTAESDQADARFGYAVATAGDVNGDGFSDVIVSADQFDGGQVDEGRAFVYHGSAAGLSLAPAWSAEGNQTGAVFGRSVAGAGDVNADGYSDVIVGAFGYDSGQTDEGRAFVYHGSAGGLSLGSVWSTEGDQTTAHYGVSVATAGDVNGDGYSDVIVGARAFDNGQSDEGRAFVYHGSASGLSLVSAWTAEGDQGGAFFGWSVGTAGDVNGDGYSDVIVGADGFTNGQTSEGRAFVYHGSAGGLSLTPAWTAESDQVFATYGTSVATAGDVNGDGFSDVIVGADEFDNGQAEEGRAFVYHGSASGLSPTAQWSAESDAARAQLGESVATAGDVNGDGFSDVIVGARLFDNGQFDEGRAFVYHGAPTGLSSTASWIAESDQDSAQFGSSVAAAGDVNGDGFGDVIVGAESFTDGQPLEGGAFVYHGSPAGLSLTPDWSAESDQDTAFFGVSVGTAGDVNGDGYGDVVVGAHQFDHGQAYEGRAFVYHGSASGLSPVADWTAESDQAFALFGYSVATAGDVNGDGFSDVVVGAWRFANGQPEEGRAFVYHGSSSGLSPTANWTAEGDQASADFGVSVGTAGDVNGDGYSDVIVGANGFSNGETIEGRAFVYHGSGIGLSLAANWTAEGNQDVAVFGTSVATAGDLNADGFSDVIVGAPLYENGQADEGRAFVYHGSASGLSSTSRWTAESDQADARFGTSTATAGDVNGDGFGDVIVGARLFANGQQFEGRAFVYYGNGGAGRLTLPRQLRTDGTTPIAPLGRSDEDDLFRIRATLLSVYGRTRLQMEHEAKPRGQSFDGLNTVVGTLMDIGPDGQIPVDRVVTGLAPGTLYHWRARAKYDLVKTPFQRNGPWMHMPTNGWNEHDLRTATGPVSVADRAPHRFELRPAGANPTRDRCEVRLVLPRAAPIDADVVDVQGRIVAVLIAGETFAAGSHVLTWDGNERGGRKVFPGVYFMRVRAGSEAREHRLVLVR